MIFREVLPLIKLTGFHKNNCHFFSPHTAHHYSTHSASTILSPHLLLHRTTLCFSYLFLSRSIISSKSAIHTVRAMSTSNNNNLSPSEMLQVKFLSDTAKMPTRGSPSSAGFDLSSAEKTVVPAGGRAVVKTDLSIACPEGTYARIAPRR